MHASLRNMWLWKICNAETTRSWYTTVAGGLTTWQASHNSFFQFSLCCAIYSPPQAFYSQGCTSFNKETLKAEKSLKANYRAKLGSHSLFKDIFVPLSPVSANHAFIVQQFILYRGAGLDKSWGLISYDSFLCFGLSGSQFPPKSQHFLDGMSEFTKVLQMYFIPTSESTYRSNSIGFNWSFHEILSFLNVCKIICFLVLKTSSLTS